MCGLQFIEFVYTRRMCGSRRELSYARVKRSVT